MALGTTKISTSLVAQEIGELSTDVGTLCSSDKINKWSKWKPIRKEKIIGIDIADLESVDFGFSYARSNDYVAVSASKWVYLKPTGGATSPYRLGDFRNYNHAAIKLVHLPIFTEINIFEKESHTITFTVPTSVLGQLQMSDFLAPLVNQYLAVVISAGITGTFVLTSATKLSDGGNTIVLDLTAAPFSGISISANYNFFFVLSNKIVNPISSNASAYITDNLFVPLPNENDDLSFFPVDIKNKYAGSFSISQFTESIGGTLRNTNDFIGPVAPGEGLYFEVYNGTIYYKVIISNPTGAAINFNPLKMNVLYSANFFGYERQEDMSVYDNSWNLLTSIQSIASGGTATYYMGTTYTLFRNGTSPNASIDTPLNGSKISPSVLFRYKGSQTTSFSNFRFGYNL